MRTTALIATLLLLAAGSTGCKESIVTAPDGARLTLSATPDVIPTVDGSSRIGIEVEDSTGDPIRGAVVTLSADGPAEIPERVDTDSSGHASATLQGIGLSGSVTVKAFSGGAEDQIAVDIRKEGAPELELLASTTEIPAIGGSLEITALVSVEGDEPMPDSVLFSAEIGTIETSAAIVDGEASVTYSSGLRAGTDTIVANAGDASDSLLVTLVDEPEQLFVSLDSTSVAADGGDVTVGIDATVIGVTKDPISGQQVGLSTEAGTFSASNNSDLSTTTDSSGEVSASLLITEAELTEQADDDQLIVVTVTAGELEEIVSITVQDSSG